MFLKFRVFGNLRFLSHAETMKVMQRAFVRSGLEMKYTQGFNPRPCISLPMARSVGVESEDELIKVSVSSSQADAFSKDEVIFKINSVLPEGIEITEINTFLEKKSFGAAENEYVIELKDDYFAENKENLAIKIDEILSQQSIVVDRITDKRGWTQKVDIRKFIKSLGIENNRICACFCHSPEGSIRLDELMQIIGLNVGVLKQPIKRVKTTWI